MAQRNRLLHVAVMIGTLLLTTSLGLAQPATQPTTRRFGPPPGPPPSPQDVARLAQQGKIGVRAHDPSTIVRCKDEYWIFCTGNGVPSFHSTDLRHWTPGPPVLTERPTWLDAAVPLHRRLGFWAPDVIKMAEDRYLLFYSASTFGKQTSAIAVASNRTLDPNDPAFGWHDGGIVIQSNEHENFNAIDPAVLHDDDGKLWMVFGSYWSGIKLIELDPVTGKRLDPQRPPIAIANRREGIEASYAYKHDGHYYLFVNWGTCCRGVESTYEIRVGRSDHIEGPYVDRGGKRLLDGGGTPVLSRDGKFVGPGHAGIVTDANGKEWFSCHFYDGTQNGTPGLAVRPLTWDQEGWPVVGEVAAP